MIREAGISLAFSHFSALIGPSLPVMLPARVVRGIGRA